MGIRAEKKARTRSSLIAAARVVFERDGLAGARMETIAAEAGVGTGTIYNYFPSKTVLLAALCDGVVETTLAAGERRVARTSNDPVHALSGLLQGYLKIAQDLDRDLLRQVLGAVFELPPDELRTFISMDLRMMRQIGVMLGQLSQRGLLREDLDVDVASPLLYSIVGGAFMTYAGMPEMSLRRIRAQVRAQVRLVVEGLAAQGPTLGDSEAGS